MLHCINLSLHPRSSPPPPSFLAPPLQPVAVAHFHPSSHCQVCLYSRHSTVRFHWGTIFDDDWQYAVLCNYRADDEVSLHWHPHLVGHDWWVMVELMRPTVCLNWCRTISNYRSLLHELVPLSHSRNTRQKHWQTSIISQRVWVGKKHWSYKRNVIGYVTVDPKSVNNNFNHWGIHHCTNPLDRLSEIKIKILIYIVWKLLSPSSI